MVDRAIVVTGDYSPLADVGRDQPLTLTPQGRLRVDASLVSGGAPVAVSLGDIASGEFETVAASATAQVIGTTGAVGDYLSHLLIIPATAAAGAVSLKDGAGTAISVFAGGGTTALPTLAPFAIPLGVYSALGGWSVTTGANVSVLAVGNFT